MKFNKLFLFIFFFTVYTVQSQTYVFGSLTGNPINTAGWNLSGNAYVNGSQLTITDPVGGQSGSVFYQTPINIGICNKWRVDFDFRMFDGNAADGLAFCFLTSYPTGFVSGGGVGIPSSTNGLKIVFDTYDNGCGLKPEIQVYSGSGYDECSSNIVDRVGSLSFMRNPNFQPASIIYDNGVITVLVNGVTYLTTYVLVNYSGYMGFTASTGGNNDSHSIKNVVIYTNQATSNAGVDEITCVNTPVQIGSTSNPLYTYSWTPTTGLSDPTIANPTFSAASTGNYTYTVSTSFAADPNVCPSTDAVTVSIPVLQTVTLGPDLTICESEPTILTATTSTTGDPIISYLWTNDQNSATQTGSSITVSPAVATHYYLTATHQSGCTSTDEIFIQTTLKQNPTFTQVAPICSGASLAALPLASTNLINGTWSPALNNTATTQYTFTPNTGECATSTTMTITVNPLVTPTFTQVAPICSGTTLAALPLTSTNLINGTWSPALNNTTTTQYTFTPNTSECATSTIMTITVNPLVTPTFTQVAPICSGVSLAALPLASTNLINGTWSPALNNTATTEYTFTPNTGVCATSTTMTITVNPLVTPTFTQVAPICSGASLAALPLVSTNLINGTWSPALNNTATTQYTFTPSTGECATSTNMTITVNPLVTPTFTQVSPICSGASLAALPLASTNLINGTWSPALNNTATTQYTFTPNTGECATSTTMTITVNPLVTPTFTQVAPICSGTTLAALPLASTNLINGTWSPALNNTATTQYTFTPNTGVCATSTIMTITVNPLVTPTFTQVAPICSGASLAALPLTSTNLINGTWSPALNNTTTTQYTFTPNTSECATSTIMTITVNPLVTPTFTQVAPICSGVSLAALPLASTNLINGTWSPALNNTATTQYTFTPNTGVCATSTTMTITVNPLVTPAFTQVSPICSGASLAALPLVSTNLINGTWSPALNNIATTQYTFTPNTGVCATSSTMTITVNPFVTPAFTQVAPICSGASLAALPLVSTNLINGTWSPALNNTATTQYTFTPNTGECATSTNMTITVNPFVTPAFTQVAPICSGVSLTALPLASTNLINGTWSPALNNTTTTQYTFTPNTGECATSTTMTITVNPLVTPTFTQVAPICSGTTLAALPLTSTNLINGTWLPALNNTATTEYTFTPNAGQCIVTTTMIIVVENRVIPQFNAISPICFGASLDALPTISNDGFGGVWSPAINPALTTTYTFTPLTNQCAYERTLTIEVNQLTLPVFNPVSPICSGSTILDLPLQSVNSIEGTWFPSIDTTQTTTYLFTPLNNECATTTTLQIEVLPNTIVPQFNAISPICEGTQLNNLNPVSNNGISGVWSPALNNLVTTTYFFTPNVAQCALPTQLVIEVNQKVTPIFNSLAPICEGQTIAPLSTQSNNGIIGVWSPALNNNLTTNYLFTPNTNECALPTQLILTVHPNPIVKLAGGTICKDLDTNTITKGHVLLTNFDPYAYTINWNYENVFINGIYTNTYTAMAIGDYFVKVTDNTTGCFSVSNTVSVVEKEYSTLFTTEVTDFFSESPSVLVLSSNSENNFWYQLDSGLPQSANQFINVSHGLHEITVFDNEGCLYEKIEARIFSYPKYFTPNADGINDFWHVFDANLLPNISLFLYDRYGKFITKLTSNSIGWDGTYLGNKLPSDDYWFVIYYDENGISKTHRSHFSLKR